MEQKELRTLLGAVKDGSLSVEDAVLRFRMEPFQELGFAKPDLHRGLRQGTAEVIYGAGKTPTQIRDIAAALLSGRMKRPGGCPELLDMSFFTALGCTRRTVYNLVG